MNERPTGSLGSLDHLWVPRIVVKFPDGTPVPGGGDDQLPARSAFTLVEQWLRPRGLSLQPLFTLPPRRIQDLVDSTLETDPEYYEHHRVNFGTFFFVEVRLRAQNLCDDLQAEFPDLEYVYVEGGPAPPPAAADYQPMQVYEDPAGQGGIDAEFAWGIEGGRGDDVGFVDLERGWVLDSSDTVVDHPDLSAAGIKVIGSAVIEAMFIEHGMNTLGVIRAVENGFWCTGIAPQSNGRVISHWNIGSNGNPQFNTADRILAAIDDEMKYGDVLLIEAQTPTASGSAPVEVEPAIFKIIRLATALGIIVVEAAGNGGKDLADFSPLLDRAAWPTGDQSADSFAIIVGAAVPFEFLPYGLSNCGTRIDCFAWGSGVWTLSATEYTPFYSGTSSASAIVAGAAICVQGRLQATGSRLSPRQMRSVLTDPAGSPTLSANGTAVDKIGVMPNLKGILTNVLELTPDVYARDFVGDTGVPHSGPISMSPDIIVLRASTPDLLLGEGGGNEDNIGLSDQVQAGEAHRVYVRVRNRQPYAESNVKVTVFWSPPSTLVTPVDWNEIGSAVIPNVPGGDQLVASPPIQWPAAAVPGSGHYCFVAVVDSPGDPGPTAEDFLDFGRFMDFVRNNNNITWRNFNVIDLSTAGISTAPLELPFEAAGAWDRAQWMELQVESQLPGGAELVLDAPLGVFGEREGHALPVVDRRSGRIGMSIVPGTTSLGRAIFPAGMKWDCRLIVNVPSLVIPDAPHDLNVRQLHYSHDEDPVEVGRVTWRFVAGARPAV
jgi:hypothetical protein